MTYIIKISTPPNQNNDELNKMALLNNAININYELETKYDDLMDVIEIDRSIYEWSLSNKNNLIKFINSLSKLYKILQVTKNNKESVLYTIFRLNNPPDSKKFTNDDKDIYIQILNRLKNVEKIIT